jgi:hypothetical protein
MSEEYDLLRLNNIKRNEDYLKCLGLDNSTSKLEDGKEAGAKRKARSVNKY